MKRDRIITRVLTITDDSRFEDTNVQVTDFDTLTGVTASAYGHNATQKTVARVYLNLNSIADSPVVIDAERIQQPHKRVLKPLYTNKKLIQNSNINIQAMDLGTALNYPYKIIVTLYLR